MSFSELGLGEPLLRALAHEGYDTPTPIQIQAIPPILAGRDVSGCAQTGTGKTAAFALPLLQLLAAAPRKPLRALILTPTRELAAQIAESFDSYGRFLSISTTVIFGGVNPSRQVTALRARPDVLVATPGRLLDLLNQGVLSLSSVEHLVLDEADRMLDMGFLPDVKRILAKLPAARQSLLFSATMPPDIKALADRMLRDPAHVAAAPVATTADRIEERLYHVARAEKARLVEALLRDPRVSRALVFTRTKHGANRVASQLCRAGIESLAIHGNKSQSARTRALDAFKSGEAPVLVATDIAARGIDVDGISHVVNFDLPNVPESYVHRIGRTARAGASGIAISLCDADERTCLRDIERLIRHRIPVVNHAPAPHMGGVPEQTTDSESDEHGKLVLQAPKGAPARRQATRQAGPARPEASGEGPAPGGGRRRRSRPRWYRGGPSATSG